MSDDEVKSALRGMPMAWAGRWCQGGVCACMGCANNSGGLASNGTNREQWARCLQEMVAASTSQKPVT